VAVYPQGLGSQGTATQTYRVSRTVSKLVGPASQQANQAASKPVRQAGRQTASQPSQPRLLLGAQEPMNY